MPKTLPIAAVQPHLTGMVAAMVPGEQLALAENGETVAVVTRKPRASWPCQPGSASDRTFWMSPDFDAPLEEFAEYME